MQRCPLESIPVRRFTSWKKCDFKIKQKERADPGSLDKRDVTTALGVSSMPQHDDHDHPSVVLYALLTCPHCRRVKEMLQEYGVPFELCLVDLLTGEERSRVLAEIKSKNPEVSFPTLVVHDRVIVGYRPDVIDQALRSVKWIQSN